MRPYRLALILTGFNLAVLALVLGKLLPAAQATPRVGTGHGGAETQEAVRVLRGRSLELVDERGQVRSRIDVEQGGEVVLRLLDRNGTIRVKLGASEHGSGLVLLDEATEPGVHLVAQRTPTDGRTATTGLTVRNGEGRERIIRP